MAARVASAAAAAATLRPLSVVRGRRITSNLYAKSIVSRMASNDPRTSSSSSSTHTITLSTGDPVKIVAAPGVSDSDLRNAVDSTLFKQWLKNLESERGLLAQGKLCLRQVQIQGVDMFGRGVGFLKFKADVFEKETGTKIPGIVFARGPAVAVLILLESGGETYAVLTEQVRVPIGKSILELPAGMLDDERGDIVGTAVREVEEETGITLNAEDMVNLTEFLNPETGCKVFPSPGGCDEELSLFLYHTSVKDEVIHALHGKEMGLRDHGELIKLSSFQLAFQLSATFSATCAKHNLHYRSVSIDSKEWWPASQSVESTKANYNMNDLDLEAGFADPVALEPQEDFLEE